MGKGAALLKVIGRSEVGWKLQGSRFWPGKVLVLRSETGNDGQWFSSWMTQVRKYSCVGWKGHLR